MSRYCEYELKNGKHPSRVSDVEESDEEIILALISRFGSDVLSVKIENREIRIREDEQ